VTDHLSPVLVQPVAASEWASLREVRLRALADSPAAFGSTWVRERAFPDSTWRERASGAGGRRSWSARLGPEWVGLVGAVPEEERGGIQLVSMWVAPSWREKGVARTLIAAVIDWHRLHAPAGLWLWVNEDNQPAQGCYQAVGFTFTGERRPLLSDPGRTRLQMRYSPSHTG